MSERDPNCKRELEASSASVSPLKKKKIDDSPASPSLASSDDSSSQSRCSVTSAGEDDDDKSSIVCLSSDSNEIARNSPTFVDLEAHQISETEASASITSSSFRKAVNPGSETTEMESSSAMEREDDRKKSPEVIKSPTPGEIEEFFSELESKDQKQFIDKYNFDIVNDKPLQGRYKWDRIKQ